MSIAHATHRSLSSLKAAMVPAPSEVVFYIWECTYRGYSCIDKVLNIALALVQGLSRSETQYAGH
jgi:hypothetical protein